MKNYIIKFIVSIMLGIGKSFGKVPYKDDSLNEKRIESDK